MGDRETDMQTLDIEYWKQAILDAAEAIEAKKDDLCKLDGALGDGDHGSSMALGFREAAGDLQEISDVGQTLEAVGRAFISKVGGVTGIIFGTVFAAAGKEAKSETAVGTSDLAGMFRAALDTVKARGKVTEGDKSMVDALSPAVSALEDAAAKGLSPVEALEAAANSAKEGMEATRQMVAKVGRARYQGENAVGHIDAGAASTALIFETLSTAANRSAR